MSSSSSACCMTLTSCFPIVSDKWCHRQIYAPQHTHTCSQIVNQQQEQIWSQPGPLRHSTVHLQPVRINIISQSFLSSITQKRMYPLSESGGIGGQVRATAVGRPINLSEWHFYGVAFSSIDVRWVLHLFYCR